MKMDNLISAVTVIVLIFTAAACDDSTDLTPITSAGLTVTDPAPGCFPDTDASGSGNFTVASVSWTPDDHTFMVYEAYTVHVTLAANEGYFFADNLFAVINGQNAEAAGGGSTVTLAYTFAEIPDYENEGMDGTPEKPFKVYDVGTLKRVGAEPAGGWSLFVCYKQIDDIVLPPAGSNWTAIGNSSSYFNGTYDGGGHTIFNLTINTNADYQGMFGHIANGGTVKNIGIVNGSVRGRNNTGGLVGLNNGGIVQNCYFSGSVTGSGDTGGATGNNIYSIVQNCYFSGSVSAEINSTAGGIVGYNSGTIQNCAALNLSVTVSYGSGTGIGRVAGENSGTLANNYARSDMILKYNINTGDDKSPANNAVGVDGESIGRTQYNNQSWWENAGNWKTDGGAFAWDFADVWEWDSAAGLPVLKK